MDLITVKKFHDAYITGNDNELDRLWKNVAPKRLIKFYSAKYSENGENQALDSIRANKIWMSSPKCFNDPLDCVFNFDYRNEAEAVALNVLEKITSKKTREEIKDSYFWEKIVEAAKEDFQKIMSETDPKEESIYVTCFSEKENLQSLSMWAHYANEHKGFCVEYDFKNINNICTFGCIPVLYSDSYYQYKYDRSDDVERLLGCIYTKAKCWMPENEWRIVEMGESKGCGYKKDGALPIRIYIGCRASKALISDLQKICIDKNIELYKAELTPSSYNLGYRKIV